MKTQFKTIYFLFLVFPGIALTGCSADDEAPPQYSGMTTQAAITADNSEEIGKHGATASNETVTSDEANDANPFFYLPKSADSPESKKVTDYINEHIRYILDKQADGNVNVTTGARSYTVDNFPGICGGSIDYPDNPGETFAIHYNSVCLEISTTETITMNGSVVVTYTDTEYTMQIANFTITFSDGTVSTIDNMSVSCSFTGFSCTVYADYTGDDGRIYRVADFSATGDMTSGYFVSGTFYHPDHGYTTFNTTVAITFNCADSKPDAGQITFNGSGGSSVTITFEDCTSFSGSWNDGTNSGSFSGTW